MTLKLKPEKETREKREKKICIKQRRKKISTGKRIRLQANV